MAYTKTNWKNNSAPAISADNLNKIEDGIYSATQGLSDETQRAISEEKRIERLFTQPVNESVNAWLNAHPEATTTVQDGAITMAKISDSAKPFVEKGFVTPQMFGAYGDGVHDDTMAIQKAVNTRHNVVIPLDKGEQYKVTSTIVVPYGKQIIQGTNEANNWGYYSTEGVSNGCIGYVGAADQPCFRLAGGAQAIANIAIDTPNQLNGTAILAKRAKSFTFNADGSVNLVEYSDVGEDLNANTDCAIIGCVFNHFGETIRHYGRGLHVEGNLFYNGNKEIHSTITNNDSWKEDGATSTEVYQNHPFYNGRAMRIVNNRFHSTNENVLLIDAEEMQVDEDEEVIEQTLNGAIITNNMVDFGVGSFDIQTNMVGCIFSNNEVFRVNKAHILRCTKKVSDSVIEGNTVRGCWKQTDLDKDCVPTDAFVFASLDGTLISGNVFTDIKQRCIYVYTSGKVENCVISNNVFKRYAMATDGTQYKRTAIDLSSMSKTSIVGNTFETADTKFVGYVIKTRNRTTDVWTDNVIQNNAFPYDATYAPILVAIGSGSARNNIQ